MKSFIDLVQISVKAGDGGDGLVSFRREKFVPRGGPDGGNGGDGGDVIIRANQKLTTLYDFTHQRRFVAENGQPGGKATASGKSGQDLILEVPVGTVVYELHHPNTARARLEKVADLNRDQKQVVMAKGGAGGRGNAAYKSSTNQAPREFEPGVSGEEKHLVLELKLVADVGLIGLPNAGKSTLLSRLTNARPEIGDYPFTTLRPNLGVMEYQDKKIVLADIPGLIEGAAEGKGLGDDFLRHIERTRILVHLIDPLIDDPIRAYQAIRQELASYSPKLLEKPEIIAVNKLDITEINEGFPQIVKSFKEKLGVEIIGISGVTGQGVDELRNCILKLLQDAAEQPVERSPSRELVFRIQDLKHA